MSEFVKYDISGIQQFIFSTSKMKENIGASNIIAELFETDLCEVISDIGVNVDWKSSKELKSGSPAEIVYIGGGNAVVIYKDKETAREATGKLATKILERTYGQLRLLAGYTAKTDKYAEDFQNLHKDLDICKRNTSITQPLLGIGISMEATADKMPVSQVYKTEYLSYCSVKKREATDKISSKFLPESCDYKFPLEFDDLTSDKVRNYIAVVHIDGNNMGKIIREQLKELTGYDSAVGKMRELAQEISETFDTCLKNTVAGLICKIDTDADFKEKFLCESFLPMRIIVADGDDITFVCNSNLAFYLVETFMKELSATQYSACAGVAIIKKAFPFHRAYNLAEELCSSAKKKGKESQGEKVRNWMDFHIVSSGVMTDLKELRAENYGEGSLLCRPYEFGADWSEFSKKCKKLQKVPRNKVKSLEDAHYVSTDEVRIILSEIQSRGYLNNVELFAGDTAQYFDCLEAIDFYEEI